jgi:phage tail tube protein FII
MIGSLSMANVALHRQPKLLVALDCTRGDDMIGNVRIRIGMQELGMFGSIKIDSMLLRLFELLSDAVNESFPKCQYKVGQMGL